MKVKLLDWPEGTGNVQVPPEELTKKLKIKLLDMSEEVREESDPEAARTTSRIKLGAVTEKKAAKQQTHAKRKITLLEAGEPEKASEETGTEALEDADRKITPVDEPSM